MKDFIFEGSGVAIITPFNSTGVDFNKLNELIEWHIAEGTDAIIICGTTGESPTLPIAEHKSLIEFCVNKVNGRIPVIAGAGSNDTLHAIDTTTFAESVGADAVLSVVPYYNKPTQKGLYAHFSAIANSTKLPVLLYNVPGRTSACLTPDTVYELSKIPNIVGIKECQFSNVAKIKKLCGDNFAIYSGEDGNIVPLLSLGGQGVISVMANIIPKTTHDIVDSFLSGDIKRSLNLQLEVLDLVDAIFIESSPAPIKEAMNMLGMDVGDCRLPISSLEESSKAILLKELKALNLLSQNH